MISRLSACMVVVAGLLSPSAFAAQEQVTALAMRGHPRFLVASSVMPSMPAKVVRPESVPVLQRRISLDLANMRLEQALATIAQRGNLSLTYSRSLLSLDGRVQLHADDISVAGALAVVLLDAGIDVLIRPDGQIVLVRRDHGAVFSSGTILGRVVDGSTARPIVGATVSIKGTSLAATTSDSGLYVLQFKELAAGQHTLQARMLGYYPKELKVTIGDTSTIIRLDISLQTAPRKLDDIVTTATGKQRRREIGSAVTTINADSLLQVAPIKNLTDLLETRVPGLTAQRTSGAPGDPVRMRLRGIGSVMRGSDPIVFVDGVRIYSAHTDSRSGNMANGTVPAPSPLDQIDPNSIETVEVFKGPSAATMYGADAANGVIVITTKKGKAGPTQWSGRFAYARTSPPRAYPVAQFRWGHDQHTNLAFLCPRTVVSCVQDSIVEFQALNDPRFTVLEPGNRKEVSATVSGGVRGLTYSFTGGYTDEVGLLKLPTIEVDRFLLRNGRMPPEWMLRPQNYTTWNVSSKLDAQLSSTAEVSITASVARSEQQRSSLETQIPQLASIYVDRQTGAYARPSMEFGTAPTLFGLAPVTMLIDEFYQRTTASAVTFTTGAALTWRPVRWLNTRAITGFQSIPRDDQSLVPSGVRTGLDSLGAFSRGTGRSLVGSFGVSGAATTTLPAKVLLTTTFGMDMRTQQTDDLAVSATSTRGTNSINTAASVQASERRIGDATFGWYVEPRLQWRRLTIPIGVRFDGGDANGQNTTLVPLPKMSLAWDISEESFFPFRTLFSSLRLRSAYGIAGRQPAPGDRLRLFDPANSFVDGVASQVLFISTRGNTQLLPERSAEIEGGFDADILSGRLSLEFTAYRKDTRDMLLNASLPPSIAIPGAQGAVGGEMLTNVGKVRNAGIEAVIGVRPLATPTVEWNLNLSLTSQRNTVLEIGSASNATGSVPGFLAVQSRIMEGYPLSGLWARPILAASDLNNDGAIQSGEFILGDSLVYIGNPVPEHTAALSSTLRFFNGALSMTTNFSYVSDAVQTDGASSWVWSPAFSDPSVPTVNQVPEVASKGFVGKATSYGLARNVSTYRFNSLSINYRLPSQAARLIGSRQVTVALQGSNLGLRTNYRYGRDPNVSTWGMGEANFDTGQLPQSRLWQFMVNVAY